MTILQTVTDIFLFKNKEKRGRRKKKNTAFAEGQCPSPLPLKWTGPQGEVRMAKQQWNKQKEERESKQNKQKKREGEEMNEGRRQSSETKRYKRCPMVFYVHLSACLPGAYSSPSPARSRSRVPFIFFVVIFTHPFCVVC